MQDQIGNRRIRVILYILVFPIVLLLLCEIGLRLAGYKPDVPIPNIHNLDCGTAIGINHPTLGYVYRPGHYDCSVNGLGVSITIGKDSFRVAGPESRPDTGRLIHIYGCSITWGHALSDSATIAWLIQKALPGARVRNYGIGGCSNVQSLLLLEKNIAENNIPDIAVLNYGSLHDERNAMTASWRKIWRTIIATFINRAPDENSLRLPFARLNDRGGLDIKYITYAQIEHKLPLASNSALMNLLNEAIENFKDRRVDEQRISERVIEEMANICRQHHIKFILTGIWDDAPTRKVIAKFHNKSITAADISVDCENDVFNLMPYDPHPNALANEHYAKGILNLIAPNL